ncbi:MAG: cysteine dioxygenase [Pseudonocardiaceae bacterium]|nr:MAG: cysteine dioxygenase [Pseudonocardiaceae bacterium]
MLLHAPSPALTFNGLAPDLADLTALTRRVAADVRAGVHDVHVDPERRWYKRVHGNDFVDVWLISWATEQAAELHDHAGSLGALTVVTGRLTEEFWSVPHSGLRTRTLHAGRSVGFGHGHVHEVANPSADPAVSVHAYSPPLTAMSYYDVTGGRLRRIRSELTEPGTTQGVG